MKYIRNYERYEDQINEKKLDASTELNILINDYYNAKKTIMNNPYGFIDETITNNLKNNIEYYLEELAQINFVKLNLNEQIWFDSFKFNLDLEYKNYELELRFLGGNPSDMDKCFPLSYYNLWVIDNLNDALDVFVRDTANNIVYENSQPLIDQNKFKTFEFKMNAYLQYLISLQNNLTQGMVYNVIPSRIVARLTARNLLVQLYQKELNYFAINQKLLKEIPLEYQTNYALKYVTLVNNQKYSDLAYQIQNHLNQFIEFYLNNYVPYCLNSEYSYGGDQQPLFIFNQIERNEIEQTFVYQDNNQNLHYIYGLGLTNNDLNQHEIGLSAIKSNTISGDAIYQHYLRICTTTKYSPKEIFQIGYDLTLSIYSQMNIIANEVANLLKNTKTGNWTPIINYDNDGIGPEPVHQIQCNILVDNKFNLNEFNKWLNQENAFYGRETNYWSLTKIDNILNEPNLKKYSQQLINAGYQDWLNQLHVDNKINTISGKQAFAGAITSLANANNFKQQTTQYLNSYFFPLTQDYEILPYNIAVQEIWGAGQEGLNMFGYNVNPYYSEHKWAFPSFIIHEAVPGHHTQLAYWTKYFDGKKDDHQKPIPYFSAISFHEGWAVFMEWFAAYINLYGVNIIDNQVVYQNDENNLLFNSTNIQTIQNGFYYELVKESLENNSDNKEQVIQKSIKLAKLLCFYGYLNASQLRNIRLVVDTAIHGNFDTQTDSIQSLCSLNDVRNFIAKYSAIGIGDQINESKRYLAWPAQATSYMLGKVVFQKLFLNIANKYFLENKKDFLNSQAPHNQNCGPLFDLMLRNGEIPLKVLIKYVSWIYKI